MQYFLQLVCILADNYLCANERVSTFFVAFSLNTDYIVLVPLGRYFRFGHRENTFSA